MKSLVLMWLSGFMMSVSATLLVATNLYQPAPPVERVVEYRYHCPPIYETHIPDVDEYAFVGVTR